MKKTIFYVALIFSLQTTFAQHPFLTTFGKGEIMGIAIKDNGNHIISGVESSYGPHLFIAEVDDMGELLWSRQIESQRWDNLPRGGFTKLSNNTYLALSNSFHEYEGTYHHHIYNFNGAGEIIWATELDTAQAFNLKNIIELDTNYLIVGEKEGNVLIQYLSKDGALENRMVYPSNENIVVQKTALSLDALCIIGYFTQDSRESIYVLTIDRSGNKLWEKKLNSSHTNFAQDVAYKDNSWYIAGYTHQGTTNDKSQPIFYKLDEAGNTIAVDSFVIGTNQTTFPFNIAESPDGNILVNGAIAKIAPPNVSKGHHFFTCKITPNLQLMWSRIIEADCEPCSSYTSLWPQAFKVFDDYMLSGGYFFNSSFKEKMLIRTRLDGTVPVTTPLLNDFSEIHIWPNPATKEIKVQLQPENWKRGQYELRLYQNGKIIRGKTFFGHGPHIFNLAGLSAGIYQLLVYDEEKWLVGNKQVLVR